MSQTGWAGRGGLFEKVAFERTPIKGIKTVNAYLCSAYSVQGTVWSFTDID